MAEVRAQLNNLRLAPRKIRAVANLLKGKHVDQALDQLEHYTKRPTGPLKKLIKSAIANAENNFNMIEKNLYIKEFIVDEGVKLKRFRAKGFGRAAAIQKKTSHIRLMLDEITPGLRSEKRPQLKKENIEERPRDNKIYEARKPEIKQEIGKKRNLLGNLGRRLFQRKAI